MVTCLGSECLEKESYLHLHVFLKVSKKKDLGKGIISTLHVILKVSKNKGLRISCKRTGSYCMKTYVCPLECS